MYKKILLLVGVSMLCSCAAKQELTKFNSDIPHNVCIAQNSAVKEGALEAIQDEFESHGIKTKIVAASYTEKHMMVHPSVQREQLTDCDAIVFYTARWHWDLALYMSFANIWVTDLAMTHKIAQATYQSRGGLDKFIDARNKLHELVDGLFVVRP